MTRSTQTPASSAFKLHLKSLLPSWPLLETTHLWPHPLLQNKCQVHWRGKFFSPKIIYFNWRKIDSQYFIGLCHTSKWVSYRYTCVPSLFNPPPTPSHLLNVFLKKDALWWPRWVGMGYSGKEVQEGGDIHIHIWLIHFTVQQKSTKLCKATISQFLKKELVKTFKDKIKWMFIRWV